MLAFSDIIEFLLRVLGDEDARSEFDQNPQQALNKAGLAGVSAQDIRDARLQLADSGAVSATDDDARSAHPHGHDPVHEISYTAAHYAATEHHTPPVAHGDTFLTIDDRDNVFFQSISDDDVTVNDNSVAISGSFNTDDSVNNLTAIQDNDTTVSDDDTTINADGSFNTTNSNNSDDDLLAIQDNSVDVDVNAPASSAPVVDEDPAPVADLPEPDPEPEPEPVDDAPSEDAPAQDAADEPADVPA